MLRQRKNNKIFFSEILKKISFIFFLQTPRPPRTHRMWTPRPPRTHRMLTPRPPRTHRILTPRPPRTHINKLYYVFIKKFNKDFFENKNKISIKKSEIKFMKFPVGKRYNYLSLFHI